MIIIAMPRTRPGLLAILVPGSSLTALVPKCWKGNEEDIYKR